MYASLLYVLWVIAPFLQGAIGYRMVTRRLHRDYPFFFAYIIEQILRFLALFYLYEFGTPTQYSFAFFGLDAVEAVLQLCVTCELFVHVFRPYEGIRHLGSILLRWAGVILLFVAVLVAASSSGSEADRAMVGLFALERSLYVVEGGLLFFLFILSSALGLNWEQPGLGIALGFGIFSSINLAAFTLRIQLGPGSQPVLSLIANAGFDCAVVVWLITLYTRKPVHRFEQQMRGWDVESWNRALVDLLRRPAALSRLS